MIGRVLAALLIAVPLSGASSPAPRTHVVRIDRMKFGTMPDGVRVGDTILWVNADMVRHTATSRAGGFDVDLPAGAKSAARVRAAGTLAVICRFHPGMKAALVVRK